MENRNAWAARKMPTRAPSFPPKQPVQSVPKEPTPSPPSVNSSSSTKLIQLQRTSQAPQSVSTPPPVSKLSSLKQSGPSGALTNAARSKGDDKPFASKSPTGVIHPISSTTSFPPAADNCMIHPLHYTWVFWFMHRSPGAKIQNYEKEMKKIAVFASVESFWSVFSHLRRPHELPNISDYHLFKEGVRPVWEDDANINGGKWIVRLKKGLASRYWEDLVLAIIGDQFDVGQEICGAVLSIRNSEDILSVWNQSAHEGRINLKIRDTLKRVLSLPPDTVMEYKTHNDALKDNSSFRNTDVFR